MDISKPSLIHKLTSKNDVFLRGASHFQTLAQVSRATGETLSLYNICLNTGAW